MAPAEKWSNSSAVMVPRAGLVALCTVALTHAVLLVLSFEIARLYRSYDYQSFCKVLLGPGWIVYEIVILCGMLIALSITTTVGGTVLGDHFSIANWVGGLLIFLFVVVFSYWGREAIEKSMMLSIVALFCVLAVLVVQLFSGHANTVANAFATEPYKGWRSNERPEVRDWRWWLYPNITVLRHRAAHPAPRP